MNLTRRALLQQTSLALASVGLSQIGLSRLTRRYQEVLATPTSRKLALLIGIDNYADEVCDFSNPKGTILQGAVTDVELHRELLISRFGFHPSDIVMLQDQQATRDGIETALQFHLLDQVKDGDIVVFHFSGLGSLVELRPESDTVHSKDSLLLHRTLVPVDGTLPNEGNTELNDLMQATLAACLNTLSTQKIISLLDVGYEAPSPFQGNLRVRSRLNPLKDVVLKDNSPLRRRLATSKSKLTTTSELRTQPGHFPGVLLVGANDQGIATETNWGGFSAGVLTYSLTQNLWHTTPTTSIQTSLGQTRREIGQLLGRDQAIIAEIAKKPNLPQAIPAYLNLSPTAVAAEGVVLSNDVEKDRLDLWLGGLSPMILEYCSDLSYFECFMAPALSESSATDTQPTDDDQFVLLQGRSRKDLRVAAQLVPSVNTSIAVESIASGSLIQEKIRAIPKDVSLVVALDQDLARIEKVDATSALAAISKITSSVAGEQRADCVFGKVSVSDLPASPQDDETSTLENSSSPDPGDEDPIIRRMYGLFNPGHTLIVNTLSQKEEAVKTSVHRVTPQLKGLLAAKFLQLTENQASSRLALEVSLDIIAPQEKTIIWQKTSRSPLKPTNRLVSQWADDGTIPQVRIGDHIHYRFNNYGDRPLYCLFISIDSKGNITALCPAKTSQPISKSDSSSTLVIEASVIPANTVVSIPRTEETESWTINGPVGMMTTYVITSCAPFDETIKSLPQLKQSIGNTYTLIPLSQPLAIAQAILQDLHNASQSLVEQLGLESPSDRYSLDQSRWGTFNFTYDVISPLP